MRHKRPSTLRPAAPVLSYSFPDKGFRQAWCLFVFSSFFAVLFNAFYQGGIELKYKSKPTGHWQPSPQPSYEGFKPSSTVATPTPLPGEANPFLRLSLEGAKKRFDKKACIFIDARKPEEYQDGHIPGALNFYGNEPDKFAPLVLPQLPDKTKEIVTYCHGGDCDLSLQAAKALGEAGYTHVEIFVGGWPEWEKAGYPVTKGEAP